MKQRYVIVGAIFLVVIVAFSSFVAIKNKSRRLNSRVSIVLSPHYDDAVLSLGGFMAKREHPVVVATFFTGVPKEATTTSWDKNSGFTSSVELMKARVKENEEAFKNLGVSALNYDYLDYQYRQGNTVISDTDIEREVAKDIQALLVSYGDKQIDIYGPAIFNEDVTHPDHALVHRAYLDVERGYPQDNVTFYIYEDYPYAEKYTISSVTSIIKTLEKNSGRLYEEVAYYLSPSELRSKERALNQYVSQVSIFKSLGVDIIANTIAYNNRRCGKACEVVYKIFRVTD